MICITRGIYVFLDATDRTLHVGHSSNIMFDHLPLLLWLTFETDRIDDSGMVVNVNEINQILSGELSSGRTPDRLTPASLLTWLGRLMENKFPGCRLARIALDLHETLRVCLNWKEPQMIQITSKYELAASHRLYNPAWDEIQNRRVFGKCSNPAGHGHNYTLEITLTGRPDPLTGQIIDQDILDRLVHQHLIEPFDHKNLNEDTPEFARCIPTVENMARVFWDRLKEHLQPARLARIRVWETPKTFAEYAE